MAVEEELEKQMLDSGSWELKIRGKSLTGLGISEGVRVPGGLTHPEAEKRELVASSMEAVGSSWPLPL